MGDATKLKAYWHEFWSNQQWSEEEIDHKADEFGYIEASYQWSDLARFKAQCRALQAANQSRERLVGLYGSLGGDWFVSCGCFSCEDGYASEERSEPYSCICF